MSFPRYPQYKDSGVEWLGEVPEHWGVQPIKTVASCNDNVLAETTPDDLEIEYVEISGVQAGKGILDSAVIPFGAAPSRARRVVQDGDVIVSTVRTYLRAISHVRNPSSNMIVSTGFAVVRPRTIESHFLGYLFLAEYLIGKVISRSVGVSYPAINASDLMRFDVPIPPNNEQTTIATFLDSETAKIDALIAEQERLIALLAEKRQVVISHAVTKGLDPNVPMKDSGVEWLGEVPDVWKAVPIKYMATEPGTIFLDGDWIESKDISSNGIRYITTGNIGEGVYKEKDDNYVTEETFNKLNCTEVHPGDILISRLNNPIGRAAIIPELGAKIVTSVDNVIFRPNATFFKKYCVYLFSCAEYFRHTSDVARGTTMQRISRGLLGNIRVVFPPYREQATIATFLDSETAKIDELTTEARRAIDLLKERRSALISAAVTGKIDVRGLVGKEAA